MNLGHHVAAASALTALIALGCGEEQPRAARGLPSVPSETGAGTGGSGAGSGGEGGGCANGVCDCTLPKTGCACDNEGAKWSCGQIYVKVGDQTLCGPGEMACGGGVWGECILNYTAAQ